jgi:HTH-type transcriptional regulator, competence development regulator
MTFGERIKQLRQEHGLSQRALAAKVSLDFTYLSKIENDRVEHTPSIRTILDLAHALEVDELELLDLAQKVPSPFEAIARNQDAVHFFRRASETVKSPEQWRALTAYLDHGLDAARGLDGDTQPEAGESGETA